MNPLRAVRDALADLSGRRQIRLVDSLVEHIAATRDAVGVARAAAIGELDLHEASVRVDELEAVGDDKRAELVRGLAEALVLPIDREDLFRLSRAIDDVLDDLRDFSRELELFGPETCSPIFVPVFDAIVATLEQLHEAVATLSQDPHAAMPAGLRAKRSGKEIRRSFQDALAELLEHDVTPVVLKRREMLRRLDTVGISIGHATDALADGGLKRGR